mmetsp:Transcript_50007/g.106381  ORF Transcript_50007/g.106381 Transcript_50007/m.106381 type:complete len:214 (-) Transcript_50007:224-865(-)
MVGGNLDGRRRHCCRGIAFGGGHRQGRPIFFGSLDCPQGDEHSDCGHLRCGCGCIIRDYSHHCFLCWNCRLGSDAKANTNRYARRTQRTNAPASPALSGARDPTPPQRRRRIPSGIDALDDSWTGPRRFAAPARSAMGSRRERRSGDDSVVCRTDVRAPRRRSRDREPEKKSSPRRHTRPRSSYRRSGGDDVPPRSLTSGTKRWHPRRRRPGS